MLRFHAALWYNLNMRNISATLVTQKIAELIDNCLKRPDPAVTAALDRLALEGGLSGEAAALIAKNNRIAESSRTYCCQDTGQALFFVEFGEDAHCDGFSDAVNAAVRNAYAPARKSVADPVTRANTGDNTPAIIQTALVKGDKITITFLAKGAGSENMTRLYMLTPADGIDGIKQSVIKSVAECGKNACPPLIVGVGIGGVAETACSLSKRAILRTIGTHHERADVAQLERELLKSVNSLGIGVAGFGGNGTALAVNIEVAPTHIGMLPVSVNLQCHSARHGTVEL